MGELTMARGECLGCQKDVIKPPSMFKYWGGYCQPCHANNLRTGKIIATGYCMSCKKDIFKTPSAFKNWSGFCKQCTSERRIGKPLPNWWVERAKKNRVAPSGANHPNWRGGISDPRESERLRFRRKMQKQIFERDDYTCTICQQHGGSLQIDHIKKWSDYPELRFEASNCRTLCMACHYYVTFKRKLPMGVVWGHNLSKRVVS